MEEIFDKEYFEGGRTSDYGGYHLDHFYPYFHRTAKALVNLVNPKKVLDIGCAKGFLVFAFRELGTSAYGVDVSFYALSNAPAEIAGYLTMANIDKGNLPFANDSFELITMLEVLEHVYNYKHLMSEIRRILKKGGVVFITTPSREHRGSKDVSHVNVNSRSFWIKAFKANGFEVTKEAATHKFTKEIINGLAEQSPGTGVGKLLSKLGKAGGNIRRILIGIDIYFHVYTDLFLLRVKK